MKSLFVNPFTDFGFKKLFGEEASKPLLIDFLNSLLPETDKIIDLSFNDKEKSGRTKEDRKAIYDIYCESATGEKFIVELQKAKQNYFKDRTVYYSTFPIQEQSQKGEWDFKLKAVYCIGILDFTFADYKNDPTKGDVIHTIQLKDQNNKLFFEKLRYIYLEMPNFTKKEYELETRLDKWLYFIKHLTDFQSIPEIFKDKIFLQAFEKAEIANYDRKEMDSYEESLKTYRDLKGVIDYAYEDGETKGEAKGILKVAKAMKEMGMNKSDIANATGLSDDEIEKL